MSHRAEQKAEARAAREAAEQAALQSDRRRRLVIFGGIVLAAAVVLISVVLLVGGGSDSGGKSASANVALFDGIPQQGQWLGRADAPVVMEEYADLQCPFCKEFATDNIPALVHDFVKPGDLRIRLRLVSILGPDSAKAALYAGGVQQQNKLWPFAETFYTHQGVENSQYVTDSFLRARAQEAGANADQASKAMNTAKVKTVATGDNAAFEKFGLGGTPSFRIGPRGGQLQVVSDPAKVASAIQAALKTAKSS